MSLKPQRTQIANDVADGYLFEIQPSCVNCAESNLNFESTVWMRENQFKKLNAKQKLLAHCPTGCNEQNELSFVGKTRSLLKSINQMTDKIGVVNKSTSKLKIFHSNKTYQMDSFVLLNFNQANCFKWSLFRDDCKSPNQIPKYALKIGFDTVSQCVLYAARSTLNSNQKFQLLGYLAPSQSDKQLKAINQKDQLVQFKTFEVLCLKPSPASLKHLCRLKLREELKNKNENVEKLGQELKLKQRFINYIKHSWFLNCDDQLNRGDCLISKNNKYKLALELDGRLLLYINEQEDYLYLYENVESLWFNELKPVVCFTDFTSISFLNQQQSFSNLNLVYKDFRMNLCNDGRLELVSRYHPSKVVIQFRDDLDFYINSSKPKFDFVYFIQVNEEYTSSSSESDTESESDDDDETTTDSNTDDDEELQSQIK
jgi:hypothetical protein